MGGGEKSHLCNDRTLIESSRHKRRFVTRDCPDLMHHLLQLLASRAPKAEIHASCRLARLVVIFLDETAKVAGFKLCQSLRQQHGFDSIGLMPTNLHGLEDNYYPINSHVLPALILRFHEASEAKADRVTCSVSGVPLREFLHADDLGEACVFDLEQCCQRLGEHPYLNVGTGVDLSIQELPESVTRVTGFTGNIYLNTGRSAEPAARL